MRWHRALPFALLLFPPLAGCRSNCHLVEAELRAREEDVRVLREELQRTRLYNHALQQELNVYQGGPCGGPGGGPGVPPGMDCAVREVVLGRGTGGHPGGPCGADDALEVHLEPRDPEGQAIKVPGAAAVEVLEIDEQGLKRPLSSWEVPPEVLQRSWRTGLFTTGYRLTFPWKVWPSTEKLRVVARFRTADGRVFEADRDVEVRLLPEAERRRLLGPPGPESKPPPPATPEPLPLPKQAPALPDLTPPGTGDTPPEIPVARGQSPSWDGLAIRPTRKSPEPVIWRAATPWKKW
jgi:hypothetical protein